MPPVPDPFDPPPAAAGRPAEVLGVFLKLGCLSFGGPYAHLGYFRAECVGRRRWVSDAAFAEWVALSQCLPGPTSSQVAFLVGRHRAGPWGAGAALLGFAAPSVLLMGAFAAGLQFGRVDGQAAWLQGLQVAAVAVVAQAVRLMAIRLCPDAPRIAIAAAAAGALLVAPGPWMQGVVLAWGAGAGALFGERLRLGMPPPPAERSGEAGPGWTCAGLFLFLLCATPWLLRWGPASPLPTAGAFLRAGALVFGGGHVVLPLLQQATVGRGWLSAAVFLSGYGLAQALPGPLFSFAAYLGYLIAPGGVGNALVALVALYLPGLLLLGAVAPVWDRLRRAPRFQAPLAGVNAAVVGLLAAAFFSPVATSAITDSRRLALALAAYSALQYFRLPPWVVVLACAVLGGWLLR